MPLIRFFDVQRCGNFERRVLLLRTWHAKRGRTSGGLNSVILNIFELPIFFLDLHFISFFSFLSMQHAVEKWFVSPRYLTSRKSGTTTLHHGEGLALLDKPFMCGPQTQGHVRLSSFQRECKENSQKTRKLDLFASFMILWIYVVYILIICVHMNSMWLHNYTDLLYPFTVFG